MDYQHNTSTTTNTTTSANSSSSLNTSTVAATRGDSSSTVSTSGTSAGLALQPTSGPSTSASSATATSVGTISTKRSLATDIALLEKLKQLQLNFQKNAALATGLLDSILYETKIRSVGVQDVINELCMLSNGQFVENRVYDEELDDLIAAIGSQAATPQQNQFNSTSQNQAHCDNNQQQVNSSSIPTKDQVIPTIRAAIVNSLSLTADSVSGVLEKFPIASGDTESDLEDEDEIWSQRFVSIPAGSLKTGRFNCAAPLPYLIGSEDYISDTFVGLGAAEEAIFPSLVFTQESADQNQPIHIEPEELPAQLPGYSPSQLPAGVPQSATQQFFDSADESDQDDNLFIGRDLAAALPTITSRPTSSSHPSKPPSLISQDYTRSSLPPPLVLSNDQPVNTNLPANNHQPQQRETSQEGSSTSTSQSLIINHNKNLPASSSSASSSTTTATHHQIFDSNQQRQTSQTTVAPPQIVRQQSTASSNSKTAVRSNTKIKSSIFSESDSDSDTGGLFDTIIKTRAKPPAQAPKTTQRQLSAARRSFLDDMNSSDDDADAFSSISKKKPTTATIPNDQAKVETSQNNQTTTPVPNKPDLITSGTKRNAAFQNELASKLGKGLRSRSDSSGSSSSASPTKPAPPPTAIGSGSKTLTKPDDQSKLKSSTPSISSSKSSSSAVTNKPAPVAAARAGAKSLFDDSSSDADDLFSNIIAPKKDNTSTKPKITSLIRKDPPSPTKPKQDESAKKLDTSKSDNDNKPSEPTTNATVPTTLKTTTDKDKVITRPPKSQSVTSDLSSIGAKDKVKVDEQDKRKSTSAITLPGAGARGTKGAFKDQLAGLLSKAPLPGQPPPPRPKTLPTNSTSPSASESESTERPSPSKGAAANKSRPTSSSSTSKNSHAGPAVINAGGDDLFGTQVTRLNNDVLKARPGRGGRRPPTRAARGTAPTTSSGSSTQTSTSPVNETLTEEIKAVDTVDNGTAEKSPTAEKFDQSRVEVSNNSSSQKESPTTEEEDMTPWDVMSGRRKTSSPPRHAPSNAKKSSGLFDSDSDSTVETIRPSSASTKAKTPSKPERSQPVEDKPTAVPAKTPDVKSKPTKLFSDDSDDDLFSSKASRPLPGAGAANSTKESKSSPAQNHVETSKTPATNASLKPKPKSGKLFESDEDEEDLFAGSGQKSSSNSNSKPAYQPEVNSKPLTQVGIQNTSSSTSKSKSKGLFDGDSDDDDLFGNS